MTEQEEFEFRARLERERGESKAAPKTAPKEPTFGEQAGAFGYGALTGFAGGLGELEKAAAYDIPEIFGAREPDKRDKFMGRETIFPTIKEVQKVGQKVGIEPPRPDLSTAQTFGEVVGGFGTALPRAIRGGAKALLGTPSATSEKYAKAAESLGFKLSPAQVRQDVPVSARGATGYAEANQSLANKLASASTGKEAAEIGPEFIRSRYKELGKEFDSLYKGRDFVIGDDAINAIRSLANIEAQLPRNAQISAVKNTAETLLRNYDSLMRQPGAKPGTFAIEGDVLQRIRSDLLQGARSTTSKQDARMVYELVDAIDASIAKNYPDIAAKLAVIRPQYRNTVVLDDLTRQGGIKQGNISLEKLGIMLGGRKGGIRTGERADIDQLGEMGRQLQLRARWEPVGGGAIPGESVLRQALGTTGDVLATGALLRTRPARATQRYMAGTEKFLPMSRAPEAIAAGTAMRPFTGEEK